MMQILFQRTYIERISQTYPNILSADNCLDEDIDKHSKKTCSRQMSGLLLKRDDKYYRNYLRNQTLIDLELIEDVGILNEFKSILPNGKVFDYLRKHD